MTAVINCNLYYTIIFNAVFWPQCFQRDVQKQAILYLSVPCLNCWCQLTGRNTRITCIWTNPYIRTVCRFLNKQDLNHNASSWLFEKLKRGSKIVLYHQQGVDTKFFICHSGLPARRLARIRNPGSRTHQMLLTWIPASAGMTTKKESQALKLHRNRLLRRIVVREVEEGLCGEAKHTGKEIGRE